MFLIKENVMWTVKCKADSDDQHWVTLNSYDNKTSACFDAFRVSNKYLLIVVTEPDGSVVWSN